jgi:FSR family fosmidomycin resistance protein-like MFS transporter
LLNILLEFAEETVIKKPTGRSVFLVLLPLFVVAHLSHHLVAALITPLLPFIRDSFSMDYTRAGVLVSAFTLAYGVAQLPGGWLADRIGLSRLITMGISGVALCGILVGLSSNYVMLAAVLVLMGIMGGGYHPSASPLISSSVEQKYRGRALGIHQIGGTGSFFLSPLIAVGIANVLGWRGSFISLSIPTLIFGAAFFILLNRWGYGREGGSDKSKTKTKDEGNTGRVRYLIPVIILNTVVQVFIFSSLSFIPFYVVDNFGGSNKAAAALLSLAHSAGLWAGPLGGGLSDRFGKIPIILFTGIIAGPLIYLLNHVSPGWSISIVLLLMGMTQYMGMPVTEAYTISHAPEQRRSTLLGMYYFASRGGPGLIAPLMGYLIDKYSFYTAYTFSGLAVMLIAIVCTIIILGNKDQYK